MGMLLTPSQNSLCLKKSRKSAQKTTITVMWHLKCKILIWWFIIQCDKFDWSSNTWEIIVIFRLGLSKITKLHTCYLRDNHKICI